MMIHNTTTKMTTAMMKNIMNQMKTQRLPPPLPPLPANFNISSSYASTRKYTSSNSSSSITSISCNMKRMKNCRFGFNNNNKSSSTSNSRSFSSHIYTSTNTNIMKKNINNNSNATATTSTLLMKRNNSNINNNNNNSITCHSTTATKFNSKRSVHTSNNNNDNNNKYNKNLMIPARKEFNKVINLQNISRSIFAKNVEFVRNNGSFMNTNNNNRGFKTLSNGIHRYRNNNLKFSRTMTPIIINNNNSSNNNSSNHNHNHHQTRSFFSRKLLTDLGIPIYFQYFYGFLLGTGVFFIMIMFSTAFLGLGFLGLIGLGVWKLRNKFFPPKYVKMMKNNDIEGIRKEYGNFASMVTPMGRFLHVEDILGNHFHSEVRDKMKKECVKEINNLLTKRTGELFYARQIDAMSVQTVNGYSMVNMVFKLKPESGRSYDLECTIQASNQNIDQDAAGMMENDDKAWRYEYVTVTLPDGRVEDITRTLQKGSGNVIDASFTTKDQKRGASFTTKDQKRGYNNSSNVTGSNKKMKRYF